jgi:hypothetical protein
MSWDEAGPVSLATKPSVIGAPVKLLLEPVVPPVEPEVVPLDEDDFCELLHPAIIIRTAKSITTGLSDRDRISEYGLTF